MTLLQKPMPLCMVDVETLKLGQCIYIYFIIFIYLKCAHTIYKIAVL